MNQAYKAPKWLKQTLVKGIRHGIQFVQGRSPYGHDNPFLDGIFAPQRQEQYCTELKVKGEIPAELNGMLMRIGPNPIQVKNPKNHHWFVGDGMVHALRLENAQAVSYQSAYVGSDSVQQKLQRDQVPGKGRGVADAVNTNIMAFAGKIWALVEAGALPIELDAQLKSKRKNLLENKLQDFPFTAHPHIDPVTGDLHAVCYDALHHHQIYYLHFDAQGRLKHHVLIPVQHGPMIHDCAITASHVIILDLSITFSLKTALKGATFPYAWNEKHQPRIGLLPFGGELNDIRWYRIEPCFIFHIANAYDAENGELILDAIVHERLMYHSQQGPAENQHIQLERFIFKANSQHVERQILSAYQQEFPRINAAYCGRPYRYIYSISFAEFADPKQVQANALLCHDLHTGLQHKYQYAEDYVLGEMVFVAKPNALAENQGWLLGYVHALDCGPSKVIILDAENIAAGPVASIDLKVRVPIGFHCNWIAQPL